ncbi:glycoprotein [Bughendera virus]|uniref:Glycoprotein n=1 Tax=Bughendera virus TaxID=2740749 RepID=A0A7D4WXT8_9RHAB|nr:glycoprotein [Bughendera virus]QKV49534.1 glycoprotein [Bughendera virus]
MKKTTRNNNFINMIKYIIILLSMFRLMGGVTKLSPYRNLLLPINSHSEWKPVNLANLTCPKPKLDWTIDFHQLATEQVYRLRDLSIGEIKGYLCHKAEWITRCEYSWYLSKTVSRRIRELSPSQSECEDGIHYIKEGRETSGSFPPEECYWNSVNDESEVKIILTPHSLTYDPYTDRGLDANLLGGFCKSRYCQTTHSSVMWIQDPESHTEPCTHMIAEKLTVLSSKQGETGKRWVKTTATPAMSLEKACKLRYCGVEGILLASGLWFGLPEESIEGHDNLGVKEVCAASSEVGVLQPDYFDKSLEFKMEDLQREILCLQLLDKIKIQKIVNMFDLQYLRPHSPGFGHVYQVVNGTLMSASAQYAITTYPGEKTISRKCLGQFKDPSLNTLCVNWSSWLPMKDGVYQAFNGIIEKDGVILLPEDQLLEATWSPDMFDYIPLDKIHHPVYINISDIIHDGVDEGLIHDKTENPGDTLSGWVTIAKNKVLIFFETIGESLLIIIMIVILAWILLRLIKLSIMCVKNRGTRNDRYEEDGNYFKNRQLNVFG